MTHHELIGRVAVSYLQRETSGGEREGGTARFRLDYLSAEQAAAIAQAVLADAGFAARVAIRLPASFVAGLGLPPEILTNQRTTYFRNAACDRPVLLVANVGDDEGPSLRELAPLDTDILKKEAGLWVAVAASGLPLTELQCRWWRQALTALRDAGSHSLDQFAAYVLATRDAIHTQGMPLLNALGVALPALQVFRDTQYFTGVNEKTGAQLAKWRSQFGHLFNKRACYLRKQTPSQTTLTNDDLAKSWDRVRAEIPDALHTVVEAFIAAPPGWNDATAGLAACEWQDVRPLFDGLKPEKKSLGELTLVFYDERDSGLLTDDDREYLERLKARRVAEAQEEDKDFLRDHGRQMKEDRALKLAWDKFVFGAPLECDDFVLGLALCMEALFGADYERTQHKLKIECARRTKKELRELNCAAGQYFAARYRGFKELLDAQTAGSIQWELGDLLKFPQLVEAWRQEKKAKLNRSVARAALQLRFYIELETALPNGQVETRATQMLWVFNHNGIASEFVGDWGRLLKQPFRRCLVGRETGTVKGRPSAIDLRNTQGLRAAHGQERGSLVGTPKEGEDLLHDWPERLRSAVAQRRVQELGAGRLEDRFRAFVEEYQAAVLGFAQDGLAAARLRAQADCYRALLEEVCREAKGDLNRASLLRPLLELGVVPVEGGAAAAIVAPWQPLRLAALACKARQVAGLLGHLLTAESVCFGDTRLYFRELRNDLAHPFCPEVTVVWGGGEPSLLSLQDWEQDYSLHEEPQAKADGSGETNENPQEAAGRILEVTERYTNLYPHERASLGIVLYNCDCARLPQAVVDQLGAWQEESGEDIRCQVVLRHRHQPRLRALYEAIIAASDSDADSFVASEATRDFMARLRIGIMAEEATVPREADGPEQDLVILQDVIARHARLDWQMETATEVPFDDWVPTRWMRRKPAATDDMKSVVYLVCPAQPAAGWAYLTSVSTFFNGDWDGDTRRRLLPARLLDFNHAETGSIFEEIHRLGNWVVNYDELLDKRQLLNRGVSIIRYKQTETQGRNMVVSSRASLELLRSMLLQRLRHLALGLGDEDLNQLALRLIEDAKALSGDIVLRATKRSRNASELIGVVLSRYLIRHELGIDRHFGWYFLDDYADWLGQKEDQIADLLALSPEWTADGTLRLAAVVAEAKYIGYESLAAKRKESHAQLRRTVARVGDALFGDPGRLDRDLWLSRFSDLMVQGLQFPAQDMPDLARWRQLVRDGECEIYLRGYSHIFVSGPVEAPDCSEAVAVAACAEGIQEIYGRERLRQLLLGYWSEKSPAALRPGLAPSGNGAADGAYRRPTTRIVVRSSAGRTKTKAHSAGDAIAAKPVPADAPVQQHPVTAVTGTAPKTTLPPPKTMGGTRADFVHATDAGAPADSTHPVAPATPGPGTWFPSTAATSDSQAEQAWLKETERKARYALQQFQLQASLQSSRLTPNAALLKFKGTANLTVDQVRRRQVEFLTSHGLDLITVRAEPGLVSLMIARPQRRVLTLAEVWRDWHPDCANGNTELLIGAREENGEPLFLSPQRQAPHTLIAGGTGSGKSVLLQNILLGIAATNTPEQAQIILIDPKNGIDFFAFEHLPHLRGGIIAEQGQALATLQGLVVEMERRQVVLRDNKASNLADLRRKPAASEKPPVLWVIHDEFPNWMMTPEYRDGVTDLVGRLGTTARAAGIHLIFAAQRPDSNVMPLQLRDNLGNRLVLKVNSEGTSDIALGEAGGGAERLLGHGHLLAKMDGEVGLITAQVPFIAAGELHQTVATHYPPPPEQADA